MAHARQKAPNVVVAFRMAWQSDRDLYEGVSRWLLSRRRVWNIVLLRELPPAGGLPLFIRGGVDGVIAEDSFHRALARTVVKGRAVPQVVLNPSDGHAAREIPGRVVSVSIDSAAVGRAGAEYLAGQGDYRQYAFVGFAGNLWSEQRERAFRAALARRGTGCAVHTVTRDALRRRAELERLTAWLARLPKPAALMAASDELAQTALECCRAGGVRVPEEIAVLGVDNDPIVCTHTSPTLSSIHPDFEEAGFQGAALLDRMLRGDPSVTSRADIPVRTIVGRTSTQPSSPVGRMVVRAEEYISAHALENLHVADVARALGVSRRLLDLRFRQISASTVLQTVQNRRLDQVRHLLRTTAMPINEISRLCDFCSENHLKKLFKSRFGVSMRAFRRASLSHET